MVAKTVMCYRVSEYGDVVRAGVVKGTGGGPVVEKNSGNRRWMEVFFAGTEAYVGHRDKGTAWGRNMWVWDATSIKPGTR